MSAPDLSAAALPDLAFVTAPSVGAVPARLLLSGDDAGPVIAGLIGDDRHAHGTLVRAGAGLVDGAAGLIIPAGADARAARAAGVAVGRATGHAVITVHGVGRLAADGRAPAFIDGLLSGAYRFDRQRTRPGAVRVERVEILASGDASDLELAAIIAWAMAAAPATRLARDLVNEPPSQLTPSIMADRARDVGAATGLDVEVLDEAALEAAGCGAILGVGRGSAEPPRLAILRTRTEDPVARVALVGKGITFDAGGLFVKSAEGMVDMKGDMAGAAAILGAMSVVAACAPRVQVTGYLALSENLPGPRATKPGDVLRTRSGLTIEVNDPDAEGRMVLCDALAMAGEAKPDLIVDLATLTGSKVRALGNDVGAIYATDDRSAALLEAAGRAASEPVWRMPFVEAYRHKIDSRIADLRLCDPAAASPDSIIAALFLREFVPAGIPWVHLDMAGGELADREGEVPEGMATGYGARLLVELLRALEAGAA